MLALITKEVYSSLFIGILAGALLYSNFSFSGMLDRLFADGFIASVADSYNIGILIPIVLAIFSGSISDEISIISISACMAGAVCGDHCSPISDTTIMSSAGAQCNHINHVTTQLPYAMTAAAVSFVSYVIAGFVKNVWICLPVGIVLMVGTLFIIKLVTSKKTA